MSIFIYYTLGILSLISFIVFAFMITRLFRPAGRVEFALFFFTFISGLIIVTGQLLSLLNAIHKIGFWFIMSASLLSIATIVILSKRSYRQICLKKITLPNYSQVKSWYSELTRFEKVILTPLVLTTFVLGLLNLVTIIFAAPFNWDSMTYHLARVAYYVQHGNLNYYDANFWAQVVHPKNATILILYVYVISVRNENLTQIVQFISYWIAIASVYGISRRIGLKRSASLLSALVFALLIENLMEAITTQNDMVITAFIGCVVYCLFAFRESHNKKYLLLMGINLGLATGVKFTIIIAVPSLLLLGIYTVIWRTNLPFRSVITNLGFSLASIALGLCIFALPACYLDNYKIFGNPAGPSFVRDFNTFQGQTTDFVLISGSRNVLRYGFEFLSLDGLPSIPITQYMQDMLRAIPIKIVSLLHINLEEPDRSLSPFTFQKKLIPTEDHSNWGVFGFGLIWIIVLAQAFGFIKGPTGRVLPITVLLFLILQSYFAPYDQSWGRFFITPGLFATPLIGKCVDTRKKILQAYLIVLIIIGCLLAISGVLFRKNSPFFTIEYQSYSMRSVFSMDRMSQLTRYGGMYERPLRIFEQIVPK